MDFLPLFHSLQGRLALVVGGGEVALSKARLLADAGARLRVVAPQIHIELRHLVEQGGGIWWSRAAASCSNATTRTATSPAPP